MNPEIESTTCVNCKTRLQPDWTKCPKCLTPTLSSGFTCPNPKCNRPIEADWKECPYCYQSLSGLLTPKNISDGFIAEGNVRPFVSGDMDQRGSIVQIFNAELPINTGDVLGDRDRYRIIKSLGEGGTAAVYQAEDTILKENIALKVVQTSKGAAEGIAEKIFHEYKLHKNITDTSCIIRTQDPRPCEFKGKSLILLPMELADGGTLYEWLNQNSDVQKRRKQGIEYFRQVCMAIRAIHNAGIIHLDIKPVNILIVKGCAKIADFGIGRFLASRYKNNPEQLLKQGVGTPEYMSPEQFYVARQKNIGPASDIYSLGIVLFELLDGSLPFDGTAIELRQKHLNMQIPEITGDNEHWHQIVQRCLEKEPKNRYPDIDTLVRDIDYIMQDIYSCIDVSCPKCGHYNQNEEARICAKCHHDLSVRFNECPVCLFKNRKDVKKCKRCEFDVGLYNLSLARWDRIQRIKDEDLAETLDMLGVILKEGIDILDAGSKEQKTDYRTETLQLTRQLHKKEEKVTAMIAVAEKAFASGRIEQALENWRKVLELVPRHQKACEKIHSLKAAIDEYAGNLKSAAKLMDQGLFEKAEKLLLRCLEIKPSDEQIIEYLKSCRQKSIDFDKAKHQVEKSIADKKLSAAYAAIAAGLSLSPGNQEFLAMKTDISAKTDEVQKRVVMLNKKFTNGDIEEVSRLLLEIEDIQTDNESAIKLQKQIIDLKNKHEQFFLAAKKAFDEHKLSDAEKQIKQALSCNSKSSDIKDLEKLIENEKKKATDLIEQAISHCGCSDFEKAESLVKQSSQLWSDNPQIGETQGIINERKDKYTTHIKMAGDFLSKNECLDEAAKYIESALQMCPQSAIAKQYLKTIEAQKKQAKLLLEKACELLLSAEFEKANGLISQAKKIWSQMPQLKETLALYDKNYSHYNNLNNLSKGADNAGKLDLAIDYIQQLLKICPNSTQSQNVLKDLKKMQGKEKAKNIIAEAQKKILSAEFDCALDLIEQAKQLYSDSDTNECLSQLNSIKMKYDACLKDAKKFVADKNYDNALGKLSEALQICPQSNWPGKYTVKIKQEIKRKEFVRLALNAIIWFIIAAAIFVGIKLQLTGHLKPGMLNISLCFLTVFLNINYKTGLYQKVGKLQLLTDDNPKVFWFLFSMICFLSGIIMYVLSVKIWVIWLPIGIILYSLTIPMLKSINIILTFFTKLVLSRVFMISLAVVAVILMIVAAGKFSVDHRHSEIAVKDEGMQISAADTPKYTESTGKPEVNIKNADQKVLSDQTDLKVQSFKEPQENEKILNNLLMEAETYYRAGDLIKARNDYQQALKISDNDKIRQKLDEIEKKLNDYKDYMNKGYKASLDPASRKLAFEMYQKAKQIWDSKQVNMTIDSLLEKVQSEIDSNLDQAKEMLVQGDQDAASVKANSALQLAEQMGLKDSIDKANSLLKKINETANPGNLVWHKITTEKISCIDEVGSKRDINIRYYYNSAGMKFVYVEPKVTSDAQQQSSFYIGADEVTIAQYRTVMSDAPKWFNGDNLPAAGLSWNDAIEFCSKLSKKDGLQYNLPTAVQWEYACTAGLNTKYDCGNTITTDYANFSLAEGDSVTPKSVGSYPANILGIYDMHGNVSEWCRDQDGDLRKVLKGGSYRDSAEKLKVSSWESDSPRGNARYYGFRVIVEIK